MASEFFASGALNVIYAIILGISFLFALISLAGVGFGEIFDFDADADIDADGIGFGAISPMAMAVFGAFFSLAGLVTSMWLGFSPIPSILVALIVGGVVGGVTQLLYVYVLSVSKSSHYSLAKDEVGRSADVIISIPNEGIGTIAFDNISGRVTLGARSTTGKQIMKGSVVRVEKIVGRVAYVRPLELGESEGRLIAEDVPSEKQPYDTESYEKQPYEKQPYEKQPPNEKWLE
jgi:membrane-bound ClpP family serine protease